MLEGLWLTSQAGGEAAASCRMTLTSVPIFKYPQRECPGLADKRIGTKSYLFCIALCFEGRGVRHIPNPSRKGEPLARSHWHRSNCGALRLAVEGGDGPKYCVISPLPSRASNSRLRAFDTVAAGSPWRNALVTTVYGMVFSAPWVGARLSRHIEGRRWRSHLAS
jgi:hypothetical protein